MNNSDKLLPTRYFEAWIFGCALALVGAGMLLGFGEGFDLAWLGTMAGAASMAGAVTFVCYW